MSEMEKVLSKLTEWDKPYPKFTLDGRTWVPLVEVSEHLDAITDRVRRLLPLLEAGQAMVEWELDYRTLNHLGKVQPHPFAQWDAALKAILERP